MLIDILQETGPEEVCALLKLSSRDMMLAFPKRLDKYIESQINNEPDEFEHDDEEDQDEY